MPAGRPSAITEQVLRDLKEAFSWGCTDREACVYADIAPSTLYKYCAEHESFAELKETLKDSPLMMAKSIQHQALKDKDLGISQKVIDRVTPKKQEISGPEGKPLSITFEGVPSGPRD